MIDLDVIHIIALKDNTIKSLQLNNAHFRNHIEEIRETLEESSTILRELLFQILQNMNINPTTKTDYLSKIEYTENIIRKSLEKGEEE
jgi:hypothetical protein